MRRGRIAHVSCVVFVIVSGVGFAPQAAAAPSAGIVPAPGQWALDVDHFNAPALWQSTRGAGVTVAVVDSGVDPLPGLRNRLDRGIDELAQRTDGRVDVSSESHGTSVASVIAAAGSANGSAIAGIAPAARVMPVSIGDETSGSTSTIAQGVAYAATHGAGVINVSVDIPAADPSLRSAVRLAFAHDAVVVASAGNEGDDGQFYPAALPGVVSVSGTTRDGSRWQDGNHGEDVDLLAPATDIRTEGRSGRIVASGTTYSAAFVSGIAALLRSRYPAESAGQTIRRMLSTAAPITGGGGKSADAGAVMPGRALALPAPDDRTNPLLAKQRRVPGAVAAPSSSSGALWWGVAIGASALLAGAGWFPGRRRRQR